MATIPPTNELPEDIFENSNDTPRTEKKELIPPVKREVLSTNERNKVITPSSLQIDKTLTEQSRGEGGKNEVSKETIVEIKKEISKDISSSAESSNFPSAKSIIEQPTQEDTQSRQKRVEKGKNGSVFLRIIFMILIFCVVLVIAGVSYYFFLSREPQEVITTSDEIEEPQEVIEISKLIDTSNWNEYKNDEVGITLRYPEFFLLTKYDKNLGLPNTSSTPQLIARSEDGSEVLSIWIDTVGISHFVTPRIEIFTNPLNAGVHLILGRHGDIVGVETTRYFTSRSGIIQPDLSSILAYIPEHPGVWQYTFVYTNSKGEASEDFMKAFIKTIDLRFDSDGDGLYDDEEVEYGTDPNIADTDGDGFDDGTEVKNGFNPLGEGLLEK